MLLTSYYRAIAGSIPHFRTLAISVPTKAVEEPDSNFTPYLIFCLRTKLIALVSKILGKQGLDINFIDHQNESATRLYQKIIISDIDEKGNVIEVNIPDELRVKLQTYIDQATTTNYDDCLLLSNFDAADIPSLSWYQNMLKFVYVSPKYNPYVDDIGLHVVLSGYPDYTSQYNELQRKVLCDLYDMYKRGYVLYAQNIAEKWHLEPCDNKGVLFRPSWADKRFAEDMVYFLVKKLEGNNTISVVVGDNLITRHCISKYLTEKGYNFYFREYEVVIEVKNLLDARNIVSQIKDLRILGKVAITNLIYPIKKLDGLNYTVYCLEGQHILSIEESDGINREKLYSTLKRERII